MPDIKKVIKGLEMCHRMTTCNECPYYKDYDDEKTCDEKLLTDALELIKAQVPVEPTFSFDGDMVCGNCGELIDKRYDKCQKCGRKVKWDESMDLAGDENTTRR